MKKHIFFKAVIICLSVSIIFIAALLPTVFASSDEAEASDEISVSVCDVTRDGIINGKDMIRIMKYIFTDDYYFPEKADVNGDGIINFDDIAAVQSYFGQTCEILDDPVIEVIPPETVPEETTPPETESEGIDHSKYTYEDYINMTPQQQTLFIKSFPSISKFTEWYNAAKAEYDKNNGNIDIGEDTIDLGDIFGK